MADVAVVTVVTSCLKSSSIHPIPRPVTTAAARLLEIVTGGSLSLVLGKINGTHTGTFILLTETLYYGAATMVPAGQPMVGKA